MNVSTLADIVKISESAISHHIRRLCLVRTRKDGRYVFYARDAQHIAELSRSGLEHIQHG